MRKPLHSVATFSTLAGVDLKPGWPECGSTSGRGSRPVRPPLDIWSVQWIGVKISPGRWPDRKSVVWGKSVSVRVDLGGGRNIKKTRRSRETVNKQKPHPTYN